MMSVQINNIRINIDDAAEPIINKAAKKLRVSKSEIDSLSIIHQSIDARRKNSIFLNYCIKVDLKINENDVVRKCHADDVIIVHEQCNTPLKYGKEELKDRPVIVGMGPAGLFAGYILAKYGFSPILIDRGSNIKNRTEQVNKFWSTGVFNPNTNVQFGEGGAGTFSDGKLTTRIKDKRCDEVLNIFVKCGAPNDILYSGKPHIGTDMLKTVISNLGDEIIRMGGKLKFDTKVNDIDIKNNRINGISTESDEHISASSVIFAIGHSARDTYEMLYKKGLKLTPKAFAIGIRVEHPREFIDESQYGKYAGNPILGSADYRLTTRGKKYGRAAYTFCMCPGGFVVAAASESDHIVTNGMSLNKRDADNSNSAIVVSVNPDDYGSDSPLSGMEFQRKWEHRVFVDSGCSYNAPVQTVKDYMNKKITDQLGNVKPTYKPGIFLSDLHKYLPVYVSETLEEAILDFDRKIKGFAMNDAVLTGIETRTSAPLRIERDENFEALGISGLYPAGEGAGYAGGIISAAVDGIKIAERIISKYKPSY